MKGASKQGDPIVFGQEPELAPGVQGYLIETDQGIYIPVISATQPGSGQVATFLESLPTDRRVVFPSVISARLESMLLRRGFSFGSELDPNSGTRVDIMERKPR
jgi:hypothetical protein